MTKNLDIKSIVTEAEKSNQNQYQNQLSRITKTGNSIEMIDEAVKEVLSKLPKAKGNSLVIYGDPQSGKTELMICLTAKLLDAGNKSIIHLVTDNVELLNQNLDRFKCAGLAPSPRNATDMAAAPVTKGHNTLLFCKKNAKDLEKAIAAIANVRPIIVIDDEADFATPNSRVNHDEQTKINKLISDLLGSDGVYIGVTATPARLNLNNTFDNRTETWVRFKAHHNYTGQDVFFSHIQPLRYRLVLLPQNASPEDAKRALARFCITVAHLNLTATKVDMTENNYSMLIHTSGKTADWSSPRKTDAQLRIFGRLELRWGNVPQR